MPKKHHRQFSCVTVVIRQQQQQSNNWVGDDGNRWDYETNRVVEEFFYLPNCKKHKVN